jgi:uncharacterized protein
VTAGAGNPAGSAPPHWLSTLLYVPLLLGAGWLLARPLALLMPQWRPDQLDLAALVLALLLLLVSLPWRIRRCWNRRHPWRELGLAVPRSRAISSALQGLRTAALLLLVLTASLLLSGQARWLGLVDGTVAANGLVLGLGVGFAEELVFRGWLWGELELQLPRVRALGLQALLFGLVHPWYRLPPLTGLALLGGLTLMGLALALLRSQQDGNLWGPIGLHGGLVGGWFVLQKGLLELQAGAPAWLVGPGERDVNPIGGLLGWLVMGLLLVVLLPSTGSCKASSRGARP